MPSSTRNAQTTAKRSFENVELRRVATDFDRLRVRANTRMSYGHHLVHVTDDKIVSFVKEENLSDNVSEIANNTVM